MANEIDKPGDDLLNYKHNLRFTCILGTSKYIYVLIGRCIDDDIIEHYVSRFA